MRNQSTLVNLMKIVFLLVATIMSLVRCERSRGVDLTRYVNPFIGTAGSGNTFPGAVLPWGMVSVSPHTERQAPSGYIYGGSHFYGLGHVHLSGTGCADLGSVILTASRGNIKVNPESYRCHYYDEFAQPGYYAVTLQEPKVRIEATATLRCGFTRFLPTESGELNLLIDAGNSLGRAKGGMVEIISASEIAGYNISGGFCGEDNRQHVYFVARFSEPAKRSGTWSDTKISEEKFGANETGEVGIWLVFDTERGKSIDVKVGISYVSIDNARENLKGEIPHWNFEQVRKAGSAEWQRQLERVRVEGGTTIDQIKFYTALYHALIHPNVISDINGEYPTMGRTEVEKVIGRDRYSVFSLWDTYRTLHPLLTLLYPERQSEMIKSMLDMYSESGYLPKWELAGNETFMMVGDPAPIVIADSYIKGIRDFDADVALEAMLKPALLNQGVPAPPIRAGYHEMLQYGYIPIEQDTSQAWWVWGPVSTTLEYCLSDYAIAKMAQSLGKEDISAQFFKRAGYYQNLFDKNTHFIRPRCRDGSWMEPFNPLETEGSGTWRGSGGPGYVEGNAWHYTWFVPHDIPGLIELFGGQAAFAEKLETCFSDSHFTINNEPDIAYPYLFTYLTGEEWRTQHAIFQIMDEEFGIGPDGLPGNDDAGTISAWFVFSALGFYPACPALDEYRLGIPLFSKAVIQLNNVYYSGEKLIIKKLTSNLPNGDKAKITFNGKVLSGYQIAHSRLGKGGRLVFNK